MFSCRHVHESNFGAKASCRGTRAMALGCDLVLVGVRLTVRLILDLEIRCGDPGEVCDWARFCGEQSVGADWCAIR